MIQIWLNLSLPLSFVCSAWLMKSATWRFRVYQSSSFVVISFSLLFADFSQVKVLWALCFLFDAQKNIPWTKLKLNSYFHCRLIFMVKSLISHFHIRKILNDDNDAQRQLLNFCWWSTVMQNIKASFMTNFRWKWEKSSFKFPWGDWVMVKQRLTDSQPSTISHFIFMVELSLCRVAHHLFATQILSFWS